MTQPSARFNMSTPEAIIATFGGEFPTPSDLGVRSALDRALRSMDLLLQSHAKNLWKHQNFQVRRAILNYPTFNAFAAETDNGAFVALNAGLVLRLRCFFDAVASHHDLISVGEPEAAPLNFQLKFWSGNFPIARVAAGRGIPRLKDQQKQMFSDRLLEIALIWVFSHELTHVVDGHLAFLRSSCGLTYVNEAELGSTPGLAPIDYQCLEYDADTQATAHTLRFFVAMMTHGRTPSGDTGDGLADVSMLRMIALSLFSVFMFFGSSPAPNTLEEALTSTHPHPTLRMEAFFRAMIDRGVTREGFDAIEAEGQLRLGAAIATELYARIIGQPHPCAYSNRPKELVNQFIPAIFNHWTSVIRPQLEKVCHSTSVPTYTVVS